MGSGDCSLAGFHKKYLFLKCLNRPLNHMLPLLSFSVIKLCIIFSVGQRLMEAALIGTIGDMIHIQGGFYLLCKWLILYILINDPSHLRWEMGITGKFNTALSQLPIKYNQNTEDTQFIRSNPRYRHSSPKLWRTLAVCFSWVKLMTTIYAFTHCLFRVSHLASC